MTRWLASLCRRTAVLLLKVAQHFDPLPTTAAYQREARFVAIRNLYAGWGLHLRNDSEPTRAEKEK